jgi:hypothetical protein
MDVLDSMDAIKTPTGFPIPEKYDRMAIRGTECLGEIRLLVSKRRKRRPRPRTGTFNFDEPEERQA